MNRRTFLALGGLGLLNGFYAWQIEPFWLEFVKIRMSIKNLPQSLIGKTIMQISDIHVGDRFDRHYLIQSFKEAQKFEPDLVVYTGDFTSYKSPRQFIQLKEVFAWAVRGKIGTLGVLGNHDYGKGWAEDHVAETIVHILEKYGITVLRNEKISIQGLTIIGLDDYWGTHFDPMKVMKTIHHQEANLVLCHNPDVVDEPVWNGYQGWILSGHTHGGQCKPPFLNPPIVPIRNKKYAAGKFVLADGRTLYVNRAVGHLWQVRFNVRPEITLFTLEHSF